MLLTGPSPAHVQAVTEMRNGLGVSLRNEHDQGSLMANTTAMAKLSYFEAGRWCLGIGLARLLLSFCRPRPVRDVFRPQVRRSRC